MGAAGNQRSYEIRIRRVIDYIHDHLEGDLSLDVLAEVACLSRFHFHRVFRAMTGETLAEAIRRVRLIRAANALIATDDEISAVAARFGYPNAASFARAFKAAHGASPDVFRKRGAVVAESLRLHSGEDQMYPVVIEELPPARAVGVLHIGPYTEMAHAFHQLGGLIASRNLFPHIRGMGAIYHDGPGSKPDAELRSHAAAIIDDAFPGDIEGLDYFDLEGGKYAVMAHNGPYATLGAAYEWLYGKWLPTSGEEPRDAPPFELYVNDPRTTPPAELRTDIRLPLK